MKGKGKSCELCNQQASVFCASDSAFLCWNCDATVHHANFLVARHLRHLLCSNCNTFAGNHISGADPRRISAVCRSCLPEKIPDDVVSFPSPSFSSSSSACVSSSESRAEKIKLKRVRKIGSCSSSVTDDACSTAGNPRHLRRRSGGGGSGAAVAVAEGMFVKWSVELGLGVKGKCVASLASHALGFCLGKWKGVPFRVAAATSFWFGLRFCGDGVDTCQNLLSRLEAISGVPAKIILAAHARLARVFTHRLQLQEGCDES